MNVALIRELFREVTRLTGTLGREKPVVDDLTMTQCHILIEIGDRAMRHGDLAGALGVDPSSLTRTLTHLEKDGYVKRETNPKSRREVLISLTAKGMDALRKVNRVMDALFEKLLAQIPEEKREVVETGIRVLLEVIRTQRRRNIPLQELVKWQDEGTFEKNWKKGEPR